MKNVIDAFSEFVKDKLKPEAVIVFEKEKNIFQKYLDSFPPGQRNVLEFKPEITKSGIPEHFCFILQPKY